MESAGSDEQHMVGLDRTIFGRNLGPFDQRQQIALHAFTADIGADPFRTGADLVDLVDEDDAVLLHHLDGAAHHFFLIQELVALFRQQHGIALGH